MPALQGAHSGSSHCSKHQDGPVAGGWGVARKLFRFQSALLLLSQGETLQDQRNRGL